MDSTQPAFPVDVEVMKRIRPMQHRDCESVARLHEAAMGSSLWARLGSRFLVELYRGLIDSPEFLAFVYEEGEAEHQRIRGFIAGSLDGDAMMRSVMKQRVLVLGAAASLGVLKDPGVLLALRRTTAYFRISDDPELGEMAESLFCSFEPELRGKRISGHVNKVLFDDFLSRGHTHVKVTTEADNEGATRQLRSWGFVERGNFDFYGKAMVRFVLDLEASARVDPVSRHPAV